MNIAYEKLTPNFLENVLIELSDNFAARECMSKALNIKSQELQKLFLPLLKGSLDHSFVVKDLGTKKIIGTFLCNDLTFFVNSHFSEEFSPEFQAIMSLLSDLEHSFLDKNKDLIQEKSYFYQYAIYVDENYKGNGLANNLYKISAEHAKKSNFKNLITIPTGEISQHLWLNKFGFKKANEIVYKDFEFEKKKVFANIGQPRSCMLVVKQL